MRGAGSVVRMGRWIGLALLALSRLAPAQEAAPAVPERSDEQARFRAALNRIAEDRERSDFEIVRALTALLDEQISKRDGRWFALRRSLVLAAMPDSRSAKDPRERPAAIRAVLGSLEKFENRAELRASLEVALALANRDGTPAAPLLRWLESSKTDRYMLRLVLEALAPDPPPASLPRLLELTKYDWNAGRRTDVDPDANRPMYPVREAAVACLTILKIRTEEADDGSVTVNRADVRARLAKWLDSDDPKVWKPAAAALRRMAADAPDMRDLMKRTLAREDLPKAKREALTAAPSKR